MKWYDKPMQEVTEHIDYNTSPNPFAAILKYTFLPANT